MPGAFFGSTLVAEALDTNGIGNAFDAATWVSPANGSIKSFSQADVPSGYPGSPETNAANWATCDLGATVSWEAKTLRVTGLTLSSDEATPIASAIPSGATNIRLWPTMRFLDRNLSGGGISYGLYVKIRNSTGGLGSTVQITDSDMAAEGVGYPGGGIIDGISSTGIYADTTPVGDALALKPTYAQLTSAGFGFILKIYSPDATGGSTQMGFNGVGVYATWDNPSGGGWRTRMGRRLRRR